MTAQPALMPDDQDPLEAECPPAVIEVFKQRLASLDRGEGLTTDELRERVRAARAAKKSSPSFF